MVGKKIIWVLADDRAGNVSQCIGIAERLAMLYIRKDISYNQFGSLPNLVRGSSLLGVDISNSSDLSYDYPDLVIAAGRKTAPIAKYIKKHADKKVILVHIMNPNCSFKDFDLIAIPRHDNIKSADNIIETIGSPNHITQEKLDVVANNWEGKFSNLPEKKIALLVGGSTKKTEFSTQHAEELGRLSNEIATKENAGLLITTSRRSSESAVKKLIEQINVPYYIYRPKDQGENPYLAYLALSAAIIVTGDSISMCSESCSTGKPVYIYAPDELIPSKHKRFHQFLYEGRYATKLGDEAFNDSTKLQDSLVVCEKILMFL